jgi:hypothetical protein
MVGNWIYSGFLFYAITKYALFLQKYLSERRKGKVNSADKKTLGLQLNLVLASLFICFGVGLGIGIAQLFWYLGSGIHHSVALALNSMTSAILHVFNLWLDVKFQFAIIGRTKSKTKKLESKGSMFGVMSTRFSAKKGTYKSNAGVIDDRAVAKKGNSLNMIAIDDSIVINKSAF